MQVNGVFGQAFWAKTPRQFAAQNGADHPMRIADGQRCLDGAKQVLLRVEQHLVVERVL